MKKSEIERQLFHIVIGLIAIFIIMEFGKGVLMGVVFFTIIMGLFLVNMTFLGKKIGLVNWFIRHFERNNIPFPGWGSACYATGILLVASFLEDQNAIIAAIFIMAVGDGVSTLIGRKGRIKLPYNKKKTLEGTTAFFLFSLIGYLFVGEIIIPISLIAAIVESLDLPIDDNLSIPVVLTFLFLVI